jgi:hypothetical protein
MSDWGKKPYNEKSDGVKEWSHPFKHQTYSKTTNEGVTSLPESQKRIKLVGEEIIDFLLEKNDQYGDSALEPNRIFSQADTAEQIKVRIDDKINRLVMGTDNLEKDEDILKDLIGYLLLLLVHGRYYE